MNKPNFKFELNATLRDKVTGIEGKVTVRADYITGNNRYLLEYTSRDGVLCEAWIDEDRLEAPYLQAGESKRYTYIYKLVGGNAEVVLVTEDASNWMKPNDGYTYFKVETVNGLPKSIHLCDAQA